MKVLLIIIAFSFSIVAEQNQEALVAAYTKAFFNSVKKEMNLKVWNNRTELPDFLQKIVMSDSLNSSSVASIETDSDFDDLDK